MKNIIWFSCFAAILCFYGCNEGSENSSGPDDGVDSTSMEKLPESPAITLTPFSGSPDYADAILNAVHPAPDAELGEGNVEFTYEVENYELGVQTQGAGSNGLANSGKGQHIHAILNNQPYMAHYNPGFEKELETGNYVLLSFLSRSFHESIKSTAAFKVSQFTVGGIEADPIDLDAPHLFYSRPKGEYAGDDVNKILLDFYLINTDLSDGSHRIKATINGEDFMIHNWQPYVVEGLPMGENSFRLELLDADGNTVDSPFNPVERTVVLKAGPESM